MVAARQAILYADTQGWGRGLEANILTALGDFLARFNPDREAGWIAELDGERAGSIFLSDEGRDLARLRLLYVEPAAQGHGIGTRLVTTCCNFAREKHYRAITLWTHTILEPARRIYAAHGFRLTDTRMHDTFGEPVQGETWMLEL